MRDYRDLEGELSGMQTSFNIRLTMVVVGALAAATIILHSLVFFSIQPDSLSAAMPPALVADPND